MEALTRYPMTSRITFVECAGNSGALYAKDAAAGTAQTLHGLLSCAEWTGVPLALLLDRGGCRSPRRPGSWRLPGADPASMSRRIPLPKVRDDVLVCLYQNGEHIRPSNGYPLRLLVPGFQGNMNVKWLHRIKVTAGPTMTKDETSSIRCCAGRGQSRAIQFPLDSDKGVITRPSRVSARSDAQGFYEISVMAGSGNGKIAKVEVSADGGQSWAQAALSGLGDVKKP